MDNGVKGTEKKQQRDKRWHCKKWQPIVGYMWWKCIYSVAACVYRKKNWEKNILKHRKSLESNSCFLFLWQSRKPKTGQPDMDYDQLVLDSGLKQNKK